MAKNLYIDLNGSDYTNGLKIYGDVDNYTNPIASRNGFNVAADIATITNVNVGSNQYFKVTTVNASNVESLKSNAYGLFNLNCSSANKVNVNVRNKIVIQNDGDYIEFKFKYTGTTYASIFGSKYYNHRSIDLSTNKKVKIYDENVVSRNLIWDVGFVAGTEQVMRITKVNNTQTIGTLTGSSDAVINDDIGILTVDTLMALSQDSLSGSSKFFDGDLIYIENNGNRIYFNSTLPTHGTDTFGIDVQSVDGVSIPTLFTSALPYTAPVAGQPIIKRVIDYVAGDIIGGFTYGQSLDIQTNAIPYRNPLKISKRYTFNVGVHGHADSNSFLVPLTKGNDKNVAMLDVMHKYGSYGRIVTCASGEGGKTYAQLKKGTTYYQKLMDNITALKRIADSEGVGLNVPGVPISHGEGDTENNNWLYDLDLDTWQSDLDTDIKAITGQTNDVQLVIYQMASHTGYAKYGFVPKLQLAASNNNPNITVVKAMYNGDYYGVGNVHGTTQLYSLMGAKYGWYIHNSILQGNTVDNFEIVSNTLDVPNRKLTLKVKSPVLPMVIDTTEVTAQPDGNYGFKLIQNYLDGVYNSTSEIMESHVSITNVAVDNDTITIDFDKNPLGTILTYGMQGDGWLDINGGVVPGTISMGRTVGVRGNIRDSQGSIAQLSIVDDSDVVQHNSLDNWMPIFDLPLTNDVNSRDKINTQTSIISFNKYNTTPTTPNDTGKLIIPEDLNNLGFDIFGNAIQRPRLTNGYNWSDQQNHYLSTQVLDYLTGNGCTIQGWVKVKNTAVPQSMAGDNRTTITLGGTGAIKVKFKGVNLTGTTILTSNLETWYRFAFRTLGTGTGEILLGTETTPMFSDKIGAVGTAAGGVNPFLIGNKDGLGSSDSNYTTQWSYHPFYLTNEELENDRKATKFKL